MAGLQDQFFDDDVKLAAAMCLSEVPLEQFSKAETRELVSIFPSFPAVRIATSYCVACKTVAMRLLRFSLRKTRQRAVLSSPLFQPS